MSIDQKLNELGYTLPPAPSAVGVYKPAITIGSICYTSGHVPLTSEGEMIKGQIGRDADQQAGYDAARQCGLTILSTMKQHLGSLDKIKRVIKIVGMVNCTSDFEGHPAVINGCSELFKEVFGDDIGVGARSAVGMSSLPLGIMVEIEAIFQIKENLQELSKEIEELMGETDQVKNSLDK